jgi:hypothetical protein
MYEWVFDRYRHGKIMAEGARVHASCYEAALRKAKALFADEKDCTLELRDAPSTPPKGE